jgi:hypothetical protein
MGKWIGRAQLGARCEEEQRRAHAVGDMQAAQRLHHRLHAVLVGRDGEYAKCFPSKMLLVLFTGMRGARDRNVKPCSGGRGVEGHATVWQPLTPILLSRSQA